MNTTPPKRPLRRALLAGAAALLLVALATWLGSGEDEEKYLEELNGIAQEVSDTMRRMPATSDDYLSVGREESDALAKRLESKLADLQEEHEDVLNAYRHAAPYFSGETPVSAEAGERRALEEERQRVNDYLEKLDTALESCLDEASAQYRDFRKKGMETLNQWHAAGGSIPYLSAEEQKFLGAMQRHKAQLRGFIQRSLDADCEFAAQSARAQEKKAERVIRLVQTLPELRRTFYNCNAKTEDDGKGNFRPTANTELERKDVPDAQRASERYNLCAAPGTALDQLQACAATLKNGLESINGDLPKPLAKERDYLPENADLRFVVTADIDSTLLRHLLRDWLKGEHSPFPDSAPAFYEPSEEGRQGWFIVQRTAGVETSHPAPFDKEFWIYVRTLKPGEKAEDCLSSSSSDADILVTGDDIPLNLRESRRYDLSAMSRLCSDAVLFVDRAAGAAAGRVLKPEQLRGAATGKDDVARVFYPEGSAPRRISDIFGLSPRAGKDKVLADGQDASAAKDGLLVIPRHLNSGDARACSIALPAIAATGTTASGNGYARPRDAACAPTPESIRSHDYALSYDINLYSLSDSTVVKSFREYCGTASAQACVTRRHYVPLRAANELDFRLLTDADLPVRLVIGKLTEAGASLGYAADDAKLLGLKLSNVAFFETDRTDPEEGIKVDASDARSLSEAMAHILAPGSISSSFAVVVVGHADVRGEQRHNMTLSSRRAVSAVKKMLYAVPGGDKLRKGKTAKDKSDELLKNNQQEGIALATLGCGVWRPLTSGEERAKALELNAKDKQKAGDMLRNDRRVEFFIIVPRSGGSASSR